MGSLQGTTNLGGMVRALLVSMLLLGALPAFAAEDGEASGADDAGFAPSDSRPVVTARKHMVASANPLASQAGLEVLRAGGSAADAIVAMQMMLTLVEPQSSGLGGSAYVLYYDATSEAVVSFDGRVAFPAAANDNWLVGSNGKYLTEAELTAAGRSVGVPGALRALEAAHGRFGRLPWKTLFEPAIALADTGFELSPRLYLSIRGDKLIKQSPTLRGYVLDARGNAKKVGSRMINKELARTLRRIADEGAEAFYTGDIAEAVADTVRNAWHLPAPMTAKDLADYKVAERRTVCEPYRVWKACAVGPTSSGGTVLQMLKLLERFDLAKLGPNSAEAVHLMIEASKLARADRFQYMADPAFVPDRTRDLLDPSYVQKRSALIRIDRSMGKVSAGKPPERATWNFAPSEEETRPSTTHLVAVDQYGNAASMTSSVGDNFGTRLMVRGFMLNNQLGDARGTTHVRNTPKVNRPEPGKRVRSTMSPMLVFDRDDKLVLAIGSPGGGAIEDFVAKALIAVLDWGLDVQRAANLPNRVDRGGQVELEKDTPLAALAPALEALGHKVKVKSLTSGIQGIAIQDGVLYGGADSRREGIALGD